MAKRGPARFKERELARAVRAARQAGGVEKIEIRADGTINVILAKDGEATTDKTNNNEWDEALSGKR